MENTDHLRSMGLTTGHIHDAMALVQEAGWNQCARDWRMMIANGTGVGFEDSSGRLIASAMVLPYGAHFGWIGMVLVTKAHQRRGLAGRMMDRAVKMLEDAGLVPGLDATPAGEPVYRKRGFAPGFSLHRWHCGGNESTNNPVNQLAPAQVATVQSLDLAAFGADRAPLIGDVIRRGAPCMVTEDGTGFALSREGRIAHQIGPIIAPDEPTAIELFDRLLGALKGDVIIDIPDNHTAMAAHAEATGFTRQRPLRRMVRATQDQQGPGAMFALFGPELG